MLLHDTVYINAQTELYLETNFLDMMHLTFIRFITNINSDHKYYNGYYLMLQQLPDTAFEKQ